MMGSSFALGGWFVFHGSDVGSARQCSAESGQSASGAPLEKKESKNGCEWSITTGCFTTHYDPPGRKVKLVKTFDEHQHPEALCTECRDPPTIRYEWPNLPLSLLHTQIERDSTSNLILRNLDCCGQPGINLARPTIYQLVPTVLT